MFIVYIIYNKIKNKTYTGQTADLIKRLKRHNQHLNSKKTSFTYKNKGVWILIYQENFMTRKEALAREKQLKSYQGRKFIKKIINSQYPNFALLAQPGRATAF